MVSRKIQKLIPVVCEICGENNASVLHKHHIVERTDPNTTNHNFNLAVICANCHSKVHDGQIKIIGLYPSTQLPYHRTLVYEQDGVSNVPDIKDQYYISKPESMKVFT